MENADKKEPLLATDWEIFFIAAVFLFLFWAVYPGEKIMNNALQENKNLDLTEIYLRNIAKKYPSSFEAHFALSEIYFRQGNVQKAVEALKPLNSLNDKKIAARRDLYAARALLFSLSEQNSIEISPKLRRYYCSESFMQLYEKEKYLMEYISVLNSNRLYPEAAAASIESMKKAPNFEYRKLCLNLYLKSLRAGNILKKEVNSIDLFANDFISDDEAANEILKAYLEAQRPDKASAFAQSVLKARKIL